MSADSTNTPTDVHSTLLVKSLSDPDKDERVRAATALGERADGSVAASMVERLWAEPDFFVRETLTWALVRVADSAMPSVVAGLESGRPTEVRTQALHVLSKIADASVVDEVLPLTADPDPIVAAKADWALGRIRDPRAIPTLAAKLGQGSVEQQNGLTEVLSAFGSAAVPVLSQALVNGDPARRRHAADVLCFIGDPEAGPATQALATAAGGSDKAVALSAIMALGELSGDEAVAALEHSAEFAADDQVRAVAGRVRSRSRINAKRRALRQKSVAS